ncbi:MAG: hypothetical protein ACI4GD_05670 [Lachnospiraceae bacterium]
MRHCPTRPLRFMLYFAEMIVDYVREKKYDLYGRRKISVPTPKFVVFYNGLEKRPEREVFYLSELYQHRLDEYDLDLACTVYNINPGYNEEIQRSSKVMSGYTTFVEKVRKYEKKKELKEAIEQAIDECIAEDVLKDFFEERRDEIMEVAVLDFTYEKRLEYTARDSREEGIEEGLEKGIKKGIKKGIEKGLEEGLKILVECMQNVGVEIENVIGMVMDKYGFSREEAEKRVNNYWKISHEKDF